MQVGASRARPLQVGDVVEVRSLDEILGTLDGDGRLDGLAFMPEMATFCGRRFRVSRRSDKTCDTIAMAALRRMEDTVFLEDLRCDGSAHGGCQAGCSLFFKEQWLRPVERGDVDSALQTLAPEPGACPRVIATLDQLTATVHDNGRWSCQATGLRDASQPMSSWDPRQYVNDVRSHNFPARVVFRGLALAVVNKYQKLSVKYLPEQLRIRGGHTFPHVAGTLTKTPRATLDLQPGEYVRVRSWPEIRATLDTERKNRGLTFDAEMLPYCGKVLRVDRRVRQIIAEDTGQMVRLPGDCIVLEGAVCQALFHRFCPRAIQPFWREIWLERVDVDGTAGARDVVVGEVTDDRGAV